MIEDSRKVMTVSLQVARKVGENVVANGFQPLIRSFLETHEGIVFLHTVLFIPWKRSGTGGFTLGTSSGPRYRGIPRNKGPLPQNYLSSRFHREYTDHREL